MSIMWTTHDAPSAFTPSYIRTRVLKMMISLMSKQWINVMILGALIGCSNGFTRPHSFARPSTCHDSRQRRNDMTQLQLSSDGEKSNQDFWEKQKALAQEMSDTADMSLKE
jgi:hypothetical protein